MITDFPLGHSKSSRYPLSYSKTSMMDLSTLTHMSSNRRFAKDLEFERFGNSISSLIMI